MQLCVAHLFAELLLPVGKASAQDQASALGFKHNENTQAIRTENIGENERKAISLPFFPTLFPALIACAFHCV